jgi:8-oxo-dGTP diphosphatase
MVPVFGVPRSTPTVHFVHHRHMWEPEAAVAIVRTRGPDSTILLIRRAEREDDAWSGHWSLPGGRRDEFDVNLLQTALRELWEECGIRLLREQVSATLPPTIARRRTGPFLLVAPFVFEIETELPTMLDAKEAAGAVWIPLSMLLDPTQHSFRRVPGMPAEVWFPAIALPGAPLWGITYRLLVDWLEISSRECAGPGVEVARMTLDFLRSRGLIVLSPWHSTAPRNGDKLGPAQAAKVSGPIPDRRRNRIFLRSGRHRCQNKPHRGTAGVHSHPRVGFRGVPDRSRHGLNVGAQPRTGFLPPCRARPARCRPWREADL